MITEAVVKTTTDESLRAFYVPIPLYYNGSEKEYLFYEKIQQWYTCNLKGRHCRTSLYYCNSL